MRQLRYSHTGSGVFVGNRYQKGNGFFGRVIKNAIFPLLKYIGKQGIKTAVAIGGEAVKDPNNFKEIARKKLKEVGMEAIDDSADRIKKFVQTGKGIKRKCETIKGAKTKKTKPNTMRVIKPRSRKVTKVKPKRLVKKKAIKGSRKRKYNFLKKKKNGATTH